MEGKGQRSRLQSQKLRSPGGGGDPPQKRLPRRDFISGGAILNVPPFHTRYENPQKNPKGHFPWIKIKLGGARRNGILFLPVFKFLRKI